MMGLYWKPENKIEKLLFVLAIGFCWAYRTRDIKAQETPIEVKAHGRKVRSLFREGLKLDTESGFWGHGAERI
jgi:hypothetical protein